MKRYWFFQDEFLSKDNFIMGAEYVEIKRSSGRIVVGFVDMLKRITFAAGPCESTFHIFRQNLFLYLL